MKKIATSNLVSRLVAGLFIVLLSGCGGSSSSDPADTTTPTTPTGVTAAAMSSTEIVLSWGAASDNAGVTAYEIYAGGNHLASVPSTTTTFLYSGLAPSTEYCCTVRAIDAAGNESAPSDPPACATTAQVADTTPPAAPTGLAGSGSQNKIGLSWTAAADAAAYKVYRDAVLAGTVQTVSFLDSGLIASTQYCYTVSAIDAAGNESLASAPACITTLAPLPDLTIPAIISTSPANHATNVQTDPLTISAVFSEAMNTLSAQNVNNFTIEGVAPAGIHYDDASHTVTFTPFAPLASGATFTATISGNVQDVAGNAMGTDYVWSFTTTTTPIVTPPSVVSTSPAINATNVPVNTLITAVFSETIALTTIMNGSNFSVSPGVQNELVTYEANTNTATLTYSGSLIAGTLYTCKISKNVTDLSNHKMVDDYTWSFTTAP
jgi:chitodextrinase